MEVHEPVWKMLKSISFHLMIILKTTLPNSKFSWLAISLNLRSILNSHPHKAYLQAFQTLHIWYYQPQTWYNFTYIFQFFVTSIHYQVSSRISI